ncbi:hypothetical protein AAAC51_07510 [Priestia megaterium]
MEENKKIILLDEDFKEIDSKQGVISYSAEFYDVSYESILEGKGAYHGIKGYYVVVPESFDYNEYIKESDVVSFYRDMFMDKLSEECSNIIEAGFEYKGNQFSYDMQSQSNFNEQLLLLTIDDDEDDIEWKVKGKGFKTFDRDTFIQICKEGKKHKNFYRKKLNEMKTKVYDIKNKRLVLYTKFY